MLGRTLIVVICLGLGGCYCNQIDSFLRGEPAHSRPLK